MADKYNILFFGASYGSLLGAKVALAGHSAHLICLPEEAELINNEGAIIRLPVRGLDQPVELNTKEMPGAVTAGGPEEANPSDYDLIELPDRYHVYVKSGTLSNLGVNNLAGYVVDTITESAYSFVILTKNNGTKKPAYKGTLSNPLLQQIIADIQRT